MGLSPEPSTPSSSRSRRVADRGVAPVGPGNVVVRTSRKRLLAPLLLLALLLPERSLGADGAAGRWVVVQGRVTVAKPGTADPLPVRPGDTVAVGDLLQTAGDGRAQALLADGTVVNLSTGTSVRILQYSFTPESGRRTAVVKIIDGKVRFIVPAYRYSRFTVESAQATVAAGAADFVALVEAEATTVAALDGTLKVKNISNLIVSDTDLWSNQTTVVRSKTAPSHPAPIAPQQRKEFRRDARDF